jgi:hypothetical protein
MFIGEKGGTVRADPAEGVGSREKQVPVFYQNLPAKSRNSAIRI